MAYQEFPHSRAVTIIQNLMNFIDENESKSKYQLEDDMKQTDIPSAASVSYVNDTYNIHC